MRRRVLWGIGVVLLVGLAPSAEAKDYRMSMTAGGMCSRLLLALVLALAAGTP